MSFTTLKKNVSPTTTENNNEETQAVSDVENDEQTQEQEFYPNGIPKKVLSRFHLPVLYINDKNQWPNKPKTEKRLLTDEVAEKTCLSNCCGVEGLNSACCRLDPDDLEHVLGPLEGKQRGIKNPDEHWVENIVRWFNKNGVKYKRSDIVIDFEEGKEIGAKFFNDHEIFRRKESYPMLRFQVDGPRFSCKFLNNTTGKCTIYHMRPQMCRNYSCTFLTSNFLIKNKEGKYVEQIR